MHINSIFNVKFLFVFILSMLRVFILFIFLSLFGCQKENSLLGKSLKIENQTPKIQDLQTEVQKESKTEASEQSSPVETNRLNESSQIEATSATPDQTANENAISLKEVNVNASQPGRVLIVLDESASAVSQSIINAAIMTLKKFNSSLEIQFTTSVKFSEHLLKDFDIIIGPLNDKDDVIFSESKKHNIQYISLNKKTQKIKDKINFRPTNEQRYGSFFDFLLNNQRSEIAILLPSNKKANNFYENLMQYKNNNNVPVNIVNTEFYTEGNRGSVKKSLDKIKNNLEHYIFVNSKTQKAIKVDFKTLNREEKDSLAKDENPEFFEKKNIKKINKQTDSILIIANEIDQECILSYLNQEKMFDKNIFFITEAGKIKNIPNKEHLKNFFFLWANPLLKEEFDQEYTSLFQSKPNEISYLMYDILASIINWIEFSNRDRGFFQNNTAFHGIYGDFTFKSGVFRRFGVYKLDEGLDFFLHFKTENFFG